MVDEDAFKYFPMKTRAVYVYDEVLVDGRLQNPSFQLKIHPSELVLKRGQHHDVIELKEKDSLFQYLDQSNADVNFVTVFKQRPVQPQVNDLSDDGEVVID